MARLYKWVYKLYEAEYIKTLLCVCTYVCCSVCTPYMYIYTRAQSLTFSHSQNRQCKHTCICVEVHYMKEYANGVYTSRQEKYIVLSWDLHGVHKSSTCRTHMKVIQNRTLPNVCNGIGTVHICTVIIDPLHKYYYTGKHWTHLRIVKPTTDQQ